MSQLPISFLSFSLPNHFEGNQFTRRVVKFIVIGLFGTISLCLPTLLFAQIKAIPPKSVPFGKGMEQLQVSSNKIKKLGEMNITGWNGLFVNPKKTLSVLSPKEFEQVKYYYTLSLLSASDTIRKAFEGNKNQSLEQLSILSAEEVLKKSGTRDTAEAKAFVQRAAALLQLKTAMVNRTIAQQKNPEVRLAAGIDSKDLPEISWKRPNITVNLGLDDYLKTDDGCTECTPENDLFSPAVYLLYLLEFVSGSFDDDLKTIAQIEKRFYQTFSEIPLHQELSEEGSYLHYANAVLEAFLMQKAPDFTPPAPPSGIPLAMPHIDLSRLAFRGSLFSGPVPLGYFNSRNTIYQSFSQAFQNVPFPNVVNDLFEAYIHEFGLTPAEVHFAMAGNNSRKDTVFQLAFAQSRDLERSDLIAMNNWGLPITIGSVDTLKWRLINFYDRQMRRFLREEIIRENAGEYRDKFLQQYRAEQENMIEAVMRKSINLTTLPRSTDAFNDTLAQKRNEAWRCIEAGENCPDGYGRVYPLKRLFSYFADYYPDYRRGENKDTFAERRFRSLPPDDTISGAGFNRQLDLLAAYVFRKDSLSDPDFRKAFAAEVNKRAMEEWRIAVERAERGYRSQIRDNLVQLILNRRKELDPDKLANFLFLDLSITEDSRTTPIAFAISRIHTFIQAVQLGIALKSPADNAAHYPPLEPDRQNLWNWMQSYGTWHAAMTVLLYPENYLNAGLRTTRSYYFTQHFCDGGEDCFPESMLEEREIENKIEAYYEDVKHLRYLHPLDLISGDQNDYHYFFAADKTTNQIFYSVLSKDHAVWKDWQPLGDMEVLPQPGAWNDRQIKVLVVQQSADTYVFFFKLLKNEPDKTFKPLVAKALLRGGTATLINSWKPVGGETYPLIIPYTPRMVANAGIWPEALITVTTKQIEKTSTNGKTSVAAEFDLISVDPSSIRGKSVIGPSMLPHIKSFHIQHELLEGKDYQLPGTKPDSLPSKWLEDVIAINSDQEGKYLVWVKDTIDATTAKARYYIDQPDPVDRQYPLPEDGITPVFGNSRKKYTNGIVFRYYPKWERLFFAKEQPGTITLYKINPKNNFQQHQPSISIPHGNSIYGISNDSSLIFSSSPSGMFFHDMLNNPIKDDSIADKRAYLVEPNPDSILIQDKGTPANSIVNGPARIYNEEIWIHIPMALSKALGSAQPPNHQLAHYWLNKIVNLHNLDTTARKNHPFFKDESVQNRPMGAVVQNPFDPFSQAEMSREVYWGHIKLMYVENIVREADQLFAQDNVESVNRARELYELANRILELGAPAADSCAVATYDFYTKVMPKVTDKLGADARTRVRPQNPTSVSLTMDGPSSAGAKKLSLKWLPENPKNNSEGQPKEPETLRSHIARDSAGKAFYSAAQAIEYRIYATVAPEQMSGDNQVDIVKDVPVMALKPFCLPQNPRIRLLRWRIASNLEKIRTNRNFAGMERHLPHYAIPVNPEKILKRIAGAGFDWNAFATEGPPPVYRYSYLLERARHLTSVAQQYENSLLNAVEKLDAKRMEIQQARQQLTLARSDLELQQLRWREAAHAIRSAQLQTDRAGAQFRYYDNLIKEGLNSWEESALGAQNTAASLYSANAVYGNWNPAQSILKNVFSFGPSSFSDYAQAASSFASAFQTQASYERREQEWKFQRQLSNLDRQIARNGTEMAFDRYAIAGQESDISVLRLQFAGDNLEYFAHQQEANVELYRYLRNTFRELHREQLYMAIGMAKAAQRALEFEHKTQLDFIGYSYADYVDSEKDRYTGAERLLQDLDKMEQYRIAATSRKKEIEKTISLATAAPEAFQAFRETGVLPFDTPMKWFDRDFPGHYLRLIHDVEISVAALVPPVTGIKGTLMNPGISRAVTGPPFQTQEVVYRQPESIAISRANNSGGLFTLRPDDPLLYPFEGLGVATSWVFEMPKGSNPMDYNSIADVFFTLRYTALEDRSYRQKVLDEMNVDQNGYAQTGSKRYFSLRNEFPDAWYRFFNPPAGQLDIPTIEINLLPADFLPNEEDKKIKKITLALQLDERTPRTAGARIPFQIEFFPSESTGQHSGPLEIKDRPASTFMFNGLSPYGKWVLELRGIPPELMKTVNGKPCLDADKLKEILLIIDYSAKVHYNR